MTPTDRRTDKQASIQYIFSHENSGPKGKRNLGQGRRVNMRESMFNSFLEERGKGEGRKHCLTGQGEVRGGRTEPGGGQRMSDEARGR